MSYAYPPGEGDMTAPLVVTEYFAPDCDHCAKLHLRLHDIFLRYIATHHLRVNYAVVYYDNAGKQSALFLSCVPRDDFPKVMTDLFNTQNDWAASDEALNAALQNIAASRGYKWQTISACMTAQATIDALQKQKDDATRYLGMVEVPMVVVGETKYRFTRLSRADDVEQILRYLISQLAPSK